MIIYRLKELGFTDERLRCIGEPLAGLSGPQQNYALARALFELADERCKVEIKAECPDPPHTATREDFDRWVESTSAIEKRLHRWELYTLKLDAERQLVDWAKALLEAHPEYQKRGLQAAALDLWENWQRLPAIRERFLDWCFRMPTVVDPDMHPTSDMPDTTLANV